MKPLLRLRSGLVAFVLGCLMLASVPAYAQLEVDVTTGSSNPLPIAVTRFIGSGNDATVGANIAEVIAADLERSGLFKPINENAFIQRPEDIPANGSPRFGDWRARRLAHVDAGRSRLTVGHDDLAAWLPHG